jgi:hypothetical protein
MQEPADGPDGGSMGVTGEKGDFVRIMGKFLKHENSYPGNFAKKFAISSPVFDRQTGHPLELTQVMGH